MKITNAIQFAYKEVVGYAYHNEGNKTAILVCKGGPAMGDDGNSEFYSKVSSKLGASVLVPDYIGSGRSAGKQFSIKSSTQTVAQLEELIFNNQLFQNCWEFKQQKLNIQNIILLGSSWGGTVAGLYFHFNPKSRIKNVVFSAGVLDYDSKAHFMHGGESDEEFWRQILLGWKYYYRNIEHSNWKDLVLSYDKTLNPISQQKTLQQKNILLLHGTKDNVVSWKRSKEYYDTFLKQFPDATITLKLFKKSHRSIKNMRSFRYLLNHYDYL